MFAAPVALATNREHVSIQSGHSDLRDAFLVAIVGFRARRFFPRRTRTRLLIESWSMVMFITGVLCIASGHSMGREGPSVQIGAGLASVRFDYHGIGDSTGGTRINRR
jgi:hypothetical protein